MPRKRALLNLRADHSVKNVLGAKMAAWLTMLMSAFSMVSFDTAVTLTGIFWMSSGSFWAVTFTVGILKRYGSSCGAGACVCVAVGCAAVPPACAAAGNDEHKVISRAAEGNSARE